MSGDCRCTAKRVVNAAEVVENKCSARAWRSFSNQFENAFINRVKRLILIVIVRPCVPATMRRRDPVGPKKVTLGDLLPGFVSADKSGVERIAELQSRGYLHLRLWWPSSGDALRSACAQNPAAASPK